MIMEVPSERERVVSEEEEEELNGENLQTRRKSKSHHKNISNISFTSSDTSVITSESNNSSFDLSSESSMEVNYNSNSSSNSTTNGEKPSFFENRSVTEKAVESLSQADEEASFDETNKREDYINVSQNQDSNGTTARQKGVVVEYSFSESNGGDKETDIGSNSYNVSKSPDTDADFRDVWNLLDDSSKGAIATPSKTYNADSTANKIIVLNDKDEPVDTSHTEDIEPVFEEYEVERVVMKQRTHDIICPNCKDCITERVILKRRKRKAPEPPTITAEREPLPPQDEQNTESLQGISCFSCFRIFIPKGDGFLSWIFKPKPPVPQQPGGTLLGDSETGEPPRDDGTGTRFPMWIVTCCQRDHPEKPASTPQRKPLQTPEHPEAGTAGTGDKTKISPLPFHGNDAKSQLPPTTESPRPPASGSEVSADVTKPPPSPSHVTQVNPPQTPGKPEHDLPGVNSSLTPINGDLPPEWRPIVSGEGQGSHSNENNRPRPSQNQDEGTPQQPERKPLVPSAGFPSWFLNCLQPSVDGMNPKPSLTSDDHYVQISEPQPSAPPSSVEQGPSAEVGSSISSHPLEDPRTGVAGVDIIKAIVYGGLVECITSLSVITSAAGGDATTLNIVALGLANVAGGLVLLLHNLRVLIHEHGEDRYRYQLGQPRHFLLHTVVAVISYLVFGLLSPVIYGFAFRKSDNKDYKLAAIAAASLVSIIILSTGKAYVRRLTHKAYIQTIIYYVSIGFMVSGIGYVAGNLINALLKKLGVFDPSAPVAITGLEAEVVNRAWTSY